MKYLKNILLSSFLVLFSILLSNNAQAQCNPGNDHGNLTITNISNTVSCPAGERPYWKFNAHSGNVYTFNTCTAIEDTYIRIYDMGWNLVASNDDYGPHCGGLHASIDWTANADGDFYIFIAHYPCNLINITFNMEYYTDYNANSSQIIDILHDNYNNNPGEKDSVGVKVVNHSDYNFSNYKVNLSVEQPDGKTVEYSETFNVALNSGAIVTSYVHNVDFSRGGTYNITAVTELPGVDNVSKEETFEQAPFATPFVESFDNPYADEKDHYWNLGNGFTWLNGSLVQSFFAATNDSVLSPSLSVTTDNLNFSYSLVNGLQTNDTVFVQIAEIGGAFTSIDTIVSGSNGKYNINGDNNTFTLSAYNGKRVQFQFRAKIAHTSGNSSLSLNDFNITAGYDFAVTGLQYSDFPTCESAQFPIKVNVRNEGEQTQNNTEVSVRIYGKVDQTLTKTIVGALQSGEDTLLTVGYIDATRDGKYECVATVKAGRDDNPANDIYSGNFNIDKPKFPVFINGVSPNYFSGNHWFQQNFSVNTNTLRSSMINRDESASITTFSIGKIMKNTALSFNYLIESWDNSSTYGNVLGSKDIIKIYIAEDFNGSYTEVAYLDQSGYTESSSYQTFPTIDLSDYVDKDIVVKIEIQNGTDDDETQQLRMTVNKLYVGVPDIAVKTVYYNVDQWCGNNATQIDVTLSNNTIVDAVNLPLTFEFNPENGTESKDTFVIPKVEANAANFIYTLTKTYDMSAVGNYYSTAYVSLENDPDVENNSVGTHITVKEPEPLPYVDDFSGNPFNQWKEDKYNYNAWGDRYVYTDKLVKADSAYIISPKFGDITTGAYLTFKYKVNAYQGGALIGNYLRDEDTVKVYISDDCGNTWTEVYALNHGNVKDTTGWQYIPNIVLSAYEGKTLRVKIAFTKQSESGTAEFQMDEFAMISSGDVGVQAVKLPQYVNNGSNVAICGDAADSALIIVKNYGVGKVDNVPVVLESVLGEDTLRLSGTVSTLVAGAVDSFYIKGFSTVQSESYTIRAYTTLSDDLDNSNDLSSTTLTVQSLLTLPYYYNGNSTSQQWQYKGNWTTDGNYLKSPHVSDLDTAFVTVQKIGPVEAGYKLRIKFNVYAYDINDLLIGNFMRDNDKFDIQVSTDCGTSFTSLETFTRANYVMNDKDTVLVVDLDAYTGKNVVFRIVLIQGENIGKIAVNIDYLYITIPQPDAVLSKVFVEDNICGKPAEPVNAVISNASVYDDLTGFDVIAYIKNNDGDVLDTLTYHYTNILYPGDVDTIVVGTFDSQLPDKYKVEAAIDLADDVNTSNNNATTTFTIWDVMPYNYSNDFTGNADGWKFANGAYYVSNSYLFTNWIMINDTVVMFSPKIGPLADNSILSFDFKDWSSDFSVGDSVLVLVSTDCGESYHLVGAVTNSDNLSNFEEGTFEGSLSAYAGQTVQFALLFKNINGGNYQMTIDNFRIIYTDVKVLGIVTETDKFDIDTYNPGDNVNNFAERYITCGDNADSLYVVFENTGKTDVNTVNVTVSYVGKTSGLLSGTFNGIMEPGDRAYEYVGTIDTKTPGLIDMSAVITVPDDAVEQNDTIGFSVTTQEVYDIPYDAFDNTRFNEGFYWKYDEDGFMGAYPWLGGNYNDIGASGLDKGDTAFAITPKLMIDDDEDYLYFDYFVQNSLNEGHIIHDEIAEILVSADCGNSWAQIWKVDVNTTDFGASGTVALDLSAYKGHSIRIMFRGIKGYSDGLFSVGFDNIHVEDYPPVDITATLDNEEYQSGTTFCEGVSVTFTTNVIMNFNYQWQLENQEGEQLLNNGSTFTWTLSGADTGRVVLYTWGRSTGILYTDTFKIGGVNLLPAKPEITGDQEVVSNVASTLYNAHGTNATQYFWNINTGGIIAGYDSAAIADWTEGYMGYVSISVQGHNECGYGPVSDEYIVYVEYLNPGSSSDANTSTKKSANVTATVYPNPSNGKFSVVMSSDSWKGTRYTIVNSLGLVVKQDIFRGNSIKVDLKGMMKGIYYMNITTLDGKVVKKSLIIN